MITLNPIVFIFPKELICPGEVENDRNLAFAS